MRALLVCLALLLSSADGRAAPACERRTFAIAVDPGHTIDSPGATSARGIPEVHFNTHLASRLVRALQKAGFDTVFLTNPDGAPIALLDRSRIANDRDARLFLSIHHDAAQPQFFSTWSHQGVRRSYTDDFKGHSLFVSQQNGDASGSLRFARLLGDRLRSRCFAPTLHHAEKIAGESRELLDVERGIYRFDDLAVLRSTRMPAVLFEAGLIVNRHEETLLRSARYQTRMIAAITDAIVDFCAGAQPPASMPSQRAECR